jgi:hypothetical protein
MLIETAESEKRSQLRRSVMSPMTEHFAPPELWGFVCCGFYKHFVPPGLKNKTDLGAWPSVDCELAETNR